MTKQHQFVAGEIIIRENDYGETAFVIEQGRVSVTKMRSGRTIHLAELGPGGTIGEMSMIDEKPRSATVTALENTVLNEVHRDEFFEALKNETDSAFRLLRIIFERLREADVRIAELVSNQPSEVPENESEIEDQNLYAKLEAHSPEAEDLLSDGPKLIKHFPFRIGRPSSDPLSHNDLVLNCVKPYQISRHHVSIIRQDGKIGIMDRGSTFGSSVDGKLSGGEKGTSEPIFFDPDGGILTLGNEYSQIKFKVSIVQD